MAREKTLDKLNDINNLDISSSFDTNVGLNSHVSKICTSDINKTNI